MLAATSPPDRRALRNDGLLARLKDGELEAFRQGSRGGAHEAPLAYRADGEVDLTRIRLLTHI